LYSWRSATCPTALLKASSKVSLGEGRGLEDPAGLSMYSDLHIALYTHRCQASRTSHNRPPPLTPDYPYPRIGVGVLRGSRASTQAHHYAQVQHIVVDLEEPRSLRPTIGGPASGAMRHPAYQLLRIPLPRTQVNRGRGEPPSARVGTFRDVPSEAQHSYALFPDIIDA
jgi:hypothetical protein